MSGVELGIGEKLRFARELSIPRSRHTPREDRRDISAHYDLPKEFFELFLDERLVYSCAYFLHPEQMLEQAQAQKLDLVCRKLNLEPSDLMLDIGCGWGTLPCWAADHHGVTAHSSHCDSHRSCDTVTLPCADACGIDADCTSGGRPFCEPQRLVCIECRSDADCSGRCLLPNGECVDCLSDADCLEPSNPRCDAADHHCVGS